MCQHRRAVSGVQLAARPRPHIQLAARVRPHLAAALPGLVAVALMIVWAADDGGFDATTWYWGALVSLGVLGATLVARRGAVALPRSLVIALSAFSLYVAWSYLSMTWAQYPGAALEGSNRALLYLLVFTLMATIPWTVPAAQAALLVFAFAIGVIALVLLFHLSSGSRIPGLFIGGRLAAPTGYENGTAALFTLAALVSIALASRRHLPGIMRGLLFTGACADLQLAVIPQSRGWLFTLPLVAIAAVAVADRRLRTTVATIIPTAGALVALRPLLRVFHPDGGAPLIAAAKTAGHEGIMCCAGVLVAGTLLAWAEQTRPAPRLTRRPRIALGVVLAAIALGGGVAAALAVSNGHPISLLKREWHGFTHAPTTYFSGTHFVDVGSERYDVWRVSLLAVKAHPIGGLGQDNFGDYYLLHRKVGIEVSWTHSLEMRLLAHTGIVGTALFVVFLVAALAAAGRARRRGDPLVRGIAAAALMPMVVWLIHGSIDWFWELPALTGPALGFVAMAGRLGSLRERASVADPGPVAGVEARRRRWSPAAGQAALAAGVVALVAGTVVLGLPYLSARDVDRASGIGGRNPAAAYSALRRSHDLDPLSSDPGVVGGTIALEDGQWDIAGPWFAQATDKEPGSWFAWLGAGLVASAQGDRVRAERDFARAKSINSIQPAVQQAAAQVDDRHPLTPQQALSKLVFAP
jgi:hypothetical protein